jgi:hypothetical protein
VSAGQTQKSRSKDQDMCRSVLDLQKITIMVVQTWLQKQRKEKKKEKQKKEKKRKKEKRISESKFVP